MARRARHWFARLVPMVVLLLGVGVGVGAASAQPRDVTVGPELVSMKAESTQGAAGSPDLLSRSDPLEVSRVATRLVATGTAGLIFAAMSKSPPAPARAAAQPLPAPPPAGTRISVPHVLWAAYVHAASEMRTSCHLPVTLLAAIGHVESGSLAGRSLTVTHDVVPPVLGPILSGGGVAAIRDTDGGRLDGDPVWDRAVGPMQFIPSTWRIWGRDGNADGVANPQNIDDAALSAATYLCAGNRDLSDPAQLRAAILSYNHSSSYLASVLGLMASMKAGGTALPEGVPAAPVPVTAGPTATARPAAAPARPTKVTRKGAATVTARKSGTSRTGTSTTTPATSRSSTTSTPPTTISTLLAPNSMTTIASGGADPAASSASMRATVAGSPPSSCDADSGATSATTGTPLPPTTTGC